MSDSRHVRNRSRREFVRRRRARPACTSRARTYARRQAGRQARTHYSYTRGRHARTHATLGGVISTASERVLRGVSSNCAGERIRVATYERPRRDKYFLAGPAPRISVPASIRRGTNSDRDTLTIVILMHATNIHYYSIIHVTEN